MSFLDSVRCSLSSVFNASCPWHASLFTRKYLPACRLTQFNFMNDMCVAFFLLLLYRSVDVWKDRARNCLLVLCDIRMSKIGGVWSQSCSHSLLTLSSIFYSSCTTRATSRLCLGRAGLLHRSGFLKSNSRQTRQGFINVFYFVRHWRLFEFHDLTIFLKFFRSYPK